MNQKEIAFLSAVCFFLLLFSTNSRCQINNELYNLLLKLPKDTILKINTYDGSGQVVHPDIIYTEAKEQKGEFYLTLTPYPLFNDSLENPCIYRSPDGLNFAEPAGIHNPLVNSPLTYKKNNHHNDDPDITYFSNSGLFRILYIQTMTPDYQLLNCLESHDLVSWKHKSLIKYDFSKRDNFVVSPSLVVKKNKYFLFYVNKRKDKKNTIEYLSSRKIYKWHKLKSQQINIDLPNDITPWHLDIIRNNDKYYMLLNAYVGAEPLWEDNIPNQYVLYVGESSDLKNWRSIGKIMDCSDIPDIDCRYVYRSTGLIQNDLFVVWYSYTNWKPEWKIGIKKFKIDSLSHK